MALTDNLIDPAPKTPAPVPPLAVPVLGGTFHVSEVLTAANETLKEVLALIDRTPADRWFVMVSDDHAEGEDSLAMVDDSLAFHIYAHGVLRQD